MTEDVGEGWQSVGAHSYRREPPNIFFLRLGEIIDGPEVQVLWDASERFAAQHPRPFWIVDAGTLAKLTVDARRAAAEALSKMSMAACVIFNARFHIRVVAKLTFKAAQLLQPSRRVPRVHDVEDEAAARAWVAREMERAATSAGKQRDGRTS